MSKYKQSPYVKLRRSINKEMKEREKLFPITSVCKDDLRAIFSDEKTLKIINEMTTDDMMTLADKMADDYCNQLFSDSLRIIFTERFMKR